MTSPWQYTIRRAEPKDERSYILLLERFVTTRGAALRHAWLYKRNPQGLAEAWLACDPGGQVVGFTAIYAREFFIDGLRVMGGVGFDAFVLPEHRRRGIALALHRASHAAMIHREVPFRFMCGPPVPANLRALVKAGSRVVGQVRYLGLPITVKGLLDMLRWRRPGLARRLEFLNSLLVRTRHIVQTATGQTTVRDMDRVDGRFDRLWEVLAPRFRVIGRRDSVYLDWRYLQNPVCRQQLVAIERGGHLLGWAVLEFAPRGCLLVDYLLPLDRTLGAHALRALIRHVAAKGAARLALRISLQSRYASLFRGHGFLPGWSKDRFQVLVGAPSLLPRLSDQPGWHFACGDLNPEASPWSVNTAPGAKWDYREAGIFAGHAETASNL
jgi:GNAT superfamily N-acetyltransferase